MIEKENETCEVRKIKKDTFKLILIKNTEDDKNDKVMTKEASIEIKKKREDISTLKQTHKKVNKSFNE